MQKPIEIHIEGNFDNYSLRVSESNISDRIREFLVEEIGICTPRVKVEIRNSKDD